MSRKFTVAVLVIALLSTIPFTALNEDVITDVHLQWAYDVLDAFSEAGFECEGNMREYRVVDFANIDSDASITVFFEQINGAGLSLGYQDGKLHALILSVVSKTEITEENRLMHAVFLGAALGLDEWDATFLESQLYLGLMPSVLFSDTLMESSVDLGSMKATLVFGSMTGYQMHSLSLWLND